MLIIDRRIRIHFVSYLRGGDPGNQMPQDSRKLTVAAGGLIRQAILRDEEDPILWDPERFITFDVKLFNAASFQQYTGFPAPPTLITAATYAAQGYPFFGMD